MNGVLSILCTLLMSSPGPNVVMMSDFGLTAEQNGDAVTKIGRAFEYALSLSEPFVLQFDEGTYRIETDRIAIPSGSVDRNVFDMVGCRGVTIDGGGAEFLFTGIGGFASIIRSEDIELRNFTIDWERPYITQAEIRSCGEDWIDLAIDRDKYPYRIIDGRMRYICADGEYGLAYDSYNNFFTPEGNILPGSFDNYWMNDMLNGEAEEIEPGVVRFRGKMKATAPPGSLLTLYHVRYRTPWATITDCDDVRLKDIVIHHTTGCGVMATTTGDLIIDNVDYIPNSDKGRVFTGVADAFHITSGYGRFVLRNCDVDGQGDDALNVHGRYCRAAGVSPDRRTLYFSDSQGILLAKTGDSIWFVDESTMQRSREFRIEAYSEIAEGLFSATLEQAPDFEIGDGIFIESASCCPDVLVEGNTFGRANRARGILLTSPGSMVVRNNVFRSSGCAILVEGDLTYWFESGGVRDLTITGNHFDRCHTSQWGHSVISFSPSPVPQDDSLPRYHTGITIEGNRFDLVEPSVLYARNVSGLVFRDNGIRVVPDGFALGNMSGPVVLEHCTGCSISVSQNPVSEIYASKKESD